METKQIDDGGPAFPFGVRVDHHDTYGGGRSIQETNEPGMTLRDYFAAQALIGILGSRQGFLIDVGTENAPVWAYKVADGMLRQRQKSEPTDDELCPECAAPSQPRSPEGV